MRLSYGVELCPAVFQMVCHLKVLHSHLGQINFYQPRIYFSSMFIRMLILLSDTKNSIKRRFSKEIENETDPYKRRLNKVQDVCRQHGLATVLRRVMENLIGTGKRELTIEGFTQNIQAKYLIR